MSVVKKNQINSSKVVVRNRDQSQNWSKLCLSGLQLYHGSIYFKKLGTNVTMEESHLYLKGLIHRGQNWSNVCLGKTQNLRCAGSTMLPF